MCFSSYLGVTVEHAEIGHYNRHWQGNHKHTTQRAETSHDQSRVRLGHHVPVAHGGHGHHGPPEALGDALEVVVRVGVQALGVVHQAGKDHHAQDEKEDEEGELLAGGLEGVDEDLEPGGVSGELEETEDPDDGEEL